MYHRELGCDVAQLKGTCDIECSLCGGVWDVRRIRGWGFNEGRGLGSLWGWLRWYIRVEHCQINVLSGIVLLHSNKNDYNYIAGPHARIRKIL